MRILLIRRVYRDIHFWFQFSWDRYAFLYLRRKHINPDIQLDFFSCFRKVILVIDP